MAKRKACANLHKQAKKLPSDMNPQEQTAYAISVAGEIDKLLNRRGCMFEFQPGFAPAANGTFTVGVAARIVVKPATYKGIPEPRTVAD